jgi:hypothetical protein
MDALITTLIVVLICNERTESQEHPGFGDIVMIVCTHSSSSVVDRLSVALLD